MDIPDAVLMLERELREIFGARLQSLVVYGTRSRQRSTDDHPAAHGHAAAPSRTLAVVDAMTCDDLRACAVRIERWHERALATPLFVAAHEFDRSLDAFPLEFGAILADHVL